MTVHYSAGQEHGMYNYLEFDAPYVKPEVYPYGAMQIHHDDLPHTQLAMAK